jgi:hypothetical protein
MPALLLTLPYELREQILTLLLCKSGSIVLQQCKGSKRIFNPPVSQVCTILREQAVQVFCQVNTFTWVIDPEAVCPGYLLSTVCRQYATG